MGIASTGLLLVVFVADVSPVDLDGPRICQSHYLLVAF